MPKFTYTGETESGESVKETVEAKDRFAVYEIARTSGHTVSGVSEAKSFSIERFLNVDRINYYLSRVKTDELVMMSRNLSAMLNAGLALTRALSVMERQSKNPRLKGVLEDVRERVSKGDQFHEALREYPKVFSPLFVAMVRAGEESGGLSDALSTISMQMERSSSLKKKVKGAMIYPAIVISIMIVIGLLMMLYVMPTMTATFLAMDVELPAITKFLISVSEFLLNNGLLAAALFAAFIGGVVMAGRTKPGRRVFHWIIVHLPIIGNLAKEVNSARTARTLSSLLKSGVDVIGAINITRDVVQNVFYKDVLEKAAEAVEKGSALSDAFTANEHLYPILVGEMILVGEESGQISQMLMEVAEYYETEVERKTKDLSTIIEPILMVVIGGGVGFFALAMISPIYSISDSI